MIPAVTTIPDVVSIAEFSSFAGHERARWRYTVGQRIVHVVAGEGTITSLDHRFQEIFGDRVMFYVDFGDGLPVSFSSWTLEFFTSVSMSPSLKRDPAFRDFWASRQTRSASMDSADQETWQPRLRQSRFYRRASADLEDRRRDARHLIAFEQASAESRHRLAEVDQQARREERAHASREIDLPNDDWSDTSFQDGINAATTEFDNLKRQYLAGEFSETSPWSPLFKILKQIDAGEELGRRELAFLASRGLFGTLALYWVRRYEETANVWHAIKASKYWRDWGRPHDALRLVEPIVVDFSLRHKHGKIKSALMDTKGGALRDIGQLDDAECCAMTAIDNDPRNYHPYNLLGAIYFQRGEPQKGWNHFAIAEAMGAPPQALREAMRDAIRRAGRIARREVAEHLLSKDAARYAWAHALLE